MAKAKHYFYLIDNLDTSAMEMRVQVTYDGKPFDVVMSFAKVSEDFAL